MDFERNGKKLKSYVKVRKSSRKKCSKSKDR